MGTQSAFGLGSLLNRVEVAAFACRTSCARTFVANRVRRLIDPYDAHANRVPATSEVFYLFTEIANDPINLLDHRLGQNFDLDTYLNSRNGTPRDRVSRIRDRTLTWYYFPEGSVSSSRFNSSGSILNIENDLSRTRRRQKFG